MSIRQPVRLLDITRLTEAYPMELLADFTTGNFTLKNSTGDTVVHNKPGTITVNQGDSTILEATDLSTNVTLNIPLQTTITGNAGSANILSTSRTLTIGNSGKEFNGSADVTWTLTEIGALGVNDNAVSASKLATPVSLTIGSSSKNFDGSAPVSWSLTEIGAATVDHNHDDTYLGINANAASASKLNTPVTIGLSGVTATATSFDGSTNISIPVTAVPASLLTGTIDIARLPAGALERMVIVADQSARYALTTDSVQTGDTVKQEDTGIMYYVKDDTNLANENGYEVYTAGAATSVPWSGVTDKPTFATVATSGSYNDLLNLPTIYQPSNTTPLVAGTAAVGTGTTFARADHVHPAQTSVTGNAGTATTLATARTLTIGSTGKDFDGSAALTWTLTEIGAAAANHNHDGVYLAASGTAIAANTLATPRTLTIGATGKEFDGSADVTWSLSEIGAAAASHSHSEYLLTTGTAAAATVLATARNITIGSTTRSFNGSAAISWTLAEIGAAAISHTHSNYLATTGGTISGALKVNGKLTVSTAGNVVGISVKYSATISTSWSGSAAPFTQAITVSGITASDTPIVDFVCSGTYATDQAREEAFGNIYRIVPSANKITVYAHKKTTTACPIQLLVVR